jgi:hypothetical protein
MLEEHGAPKATAIINEGFYDANSFRRALGLPEVPCLFG